MKNLKTPLFVFAAILAVPMAVQAKNYAGFDLCGPATQATIKSTIEAAGGKVGRVIDNTYPDELIVIASKYPIESTPRSVSVTLYKGQVAYISVGNAGDVVPVLEAKYGKKFTTSRKEEKVGITNSHHFQDPDDATLEVIISQFEIAGNKGTFYSVNYACKDLYKQVEKAREAFAASGAKK